MFQFLTRKPLWVNVLAGLIILLLLLLLFLGSLNLLTRHGETLKIPAVTGLSLADARKTLESQGFAVQIQDSVYNDTLPPLQVIKQFPEADNLVKVNRTVYLTINSAIPPFVNMPNLVSMTFRTANMTLRQYGLKLEDTLFKPYFAKNSVLDQLYNGQPIKPGTPIQQGNKITLVLGNGIGASGFVVPDFFGMNYRQAKALFDSSGLIPGALVIDKDVRDTADAFIYRQSPERFNEEQRPNIIRAGQSIDIWLSVQKPVRKIDSAAAPVSPYQ